jgi:hypothetical protein
MAHAGGIGRRSWTASRAIGWFKRANRLGSIASGIEIAKLLIERGAHRDAIRCLQTVIESEDSVSDALAEEARTLVRGLLTTAARHRGGSPRRLPNHR